MTKKQGKKVDMLALIVLFFAKYEAIINGFLPLEDQVLILITKDKAIKVLLDQQGYGSKGKSLSKAALRKLMIDGVLKLVQKGYAWALTTNDAEMLNTFGLVESDFKLSQDNLIVLVDKVLTALTDNVVALTPYKVTLISIGAIKLIEDDYVSSKDLPKQKQANKKAVTTSLSKEIKETDLVLEICDNLMTSEFKESAPAMVLEYFNDRMVINGVNRHTTVRVHAYGTEDHSEVIAGASIGIASLNRHETTDIDGMGEIVQFYGGNYLLLLKAKGFADKEVSFSILNGKQIEIDLVMNPNRIYGNIAHIGKPSGFVKVTLAGTNISTMTDAFGNYSLEKIPAGAGMLEISNEAGEKASKSFEMVMGQDLKIDFDF